ncbi:MAG: hypothetical protein QOD63_1747 [Actinomycetota bacterium]|nr:hypothetical protein [Actinomycetota bacterium]
MKFGFVLPGGTAVEQLELAVLADEAGWDGVFVWEASYGVDPWTLLAAMSQRTTHVRLGTMLTPLPWRRPWKVASQVLTLDQLSGGRAILAVGLGAVDEALGTTGEETDRRVRAERLDEGIDLIRGLFAGRKKFSGRHYSINLEAREDLDATAAAVQRPRPPIWVVGVWPRPKSMKRVIRGDGLIPMGMDANGIRPAEPRELEEMIGWLAWSGGERRQFDVIVEGETPADDPAEASAIVTRWSDVGASWWLETRWGEPNHGPERIAEVRRRLEAGPPPSR